MNNQIITKEILNWYDNNKRILPWRIHLTKRQKQTNLQKRAERVRELQAIRKTGGILNAI